MAESDVKINHIVGDKEDLDDTQFGIDDTADARTGVKHQNYKDDDSVAKKNATIGENAYFEDLEVDGDLTVTGAINGVTIQKALNTSAAELDDPIADVDVNANGFKLGSTLAGSAQHSTPGVYAAFKILNTINPGANAYATIAWNSTHYFVRTGDALEKHDKFSGEQVDSYTGLGSTYQLNTVCNEDYVAISSDNGVIVFNAADLSKRFEVDTATTNDSYMCINDTQAFYVQSGDVRIFNLSSTSDFNSSSQDATFTPSPVANGPMSADDDYIYISFDGSLYAYNNTTGYSLAATETLASTGYSAVDSAGFLYVQNGNSVAKYSSGLAAQLFNVDTGMNSSGVNPDYMQSDGLKIWRTVYDQDSSGYCYNYQLALNVLLNDNEGGAVTTNTPGQTSWAVDGETETASPEEIRAATNNLRTKTLDEVVTVDGEVDITETKSVIYHDKVKNNGDKDELSFVDTELIKAFDAIATGGVNFCTINSRYFFIFDGSTPEMLWINRKTGVVEKTITTSLYGGIGADENVIVKAANSSLRVYDIKTGNYVSYAATAPGNNVRNVIKSGGYWYTVNDADGLKAFGADDFLIADSQTLVDITEQVVSFCVDGTSVYSVDAHASNAGNLIVRDNSIADGSLTQSSATFAQKAGGGYAAQIDCFGDMLVLVYRPLTGTQETTVLLRKSDMATLFESSVETNISRSAVYDGLLYTALYSSPNLQTGVLSIPSETRELPERAKLKSFEYQSPSGKTFTGDDLESAYEKSLVSAQNLMGITVESVETVSSLPTTTIGAWHLIEDTGNPKDDYVCQYTDEGFVYYAPYNYAEIRLAGVKKVYRTNAWYDETYGVYTNDTTASAGGVPVGGVYINSTNNNTLHTRIT